MKIHILVEGPSERAFLEAWAGRFLPGCTFKVHPHQGKGALPDDLDAKPDPRNRSLLHQLPAKLRAFQATVDLAKEAVLVLVDADDENCEELNLALVKAVKSICPRLRVEVRIAVEETEAFYLGDLRALENVFAGADMKTARNYEPDSICGTWELFGRIVDDHGGRKVEWAEAMGSLMTTHPSENRSPSFRKLCKALRRLAKPPVVPKKRAKRYRHVARTDKRRGGSR